MDGKRSAFVPTRPVTVGAVEQDAADNDAIASLANSVVVGGVMSELFVTLFTAAPIGVRRFFRKLFNARFSHIGASGFAPLAGARG